MEKEYLNILARIVLPSQILDYFTISGVEQNSPEVYIGLGEKISNELINDVHFESKRLRESSELDRLPYKGPQGNS